MRNIPVWIKYVFVFGLGVLLGYEAKNYWPDTKNDSANFTISKSGSSYESESQKRDINQIRTGEKSTKNSNADIPSKVLEVLKYIDLNDQAPDGYVGGRKFKNLERLLPQKTKEGRRINYREWDVNPKMAGQNRGRERLVTGDDQSAYFTNDHYSSFQKIR